MDVSTNIAALAFDEIRNAILGNNMQEITRFYFSANNEHAKELANVVSKRKTHGSLSKDFTFKIANDTEKVVTDVNTYSKEMLHAFEELKYIRIPQLLLHLHNELEDNFCNERFKIEMTVNFKPDAVVFDDVVDLVVRINPSNKDNKFENATFDAVPAVFIPFIQYADLSSGKMPELVLRSLQATGIFHVEFSMKFNLWSFGKAYESKKIPTFADNDLFYEEYEAAQEQWFRTIMAIHKNKSHQNTVRTVFTVLLKENYKLVRHQREDTVNHSTFEISKLALEKL